jgi:putative ABC transport system permease protein
MVLWKFSFRHVLARPGRAILTLLSIVIGVAAVVSVSIATSTTSVAYKAMYETVNGRAALEVTVEGGGGFDEKLPGSDATVLDKVQQVPGVAAAVPLLKRNTVMFAGEQQARRRITLVALGIDPTRDASIRDFQVKQGEALSETSGAMLEEGFAKAINVQVGNRVRILGRNSREVTVTGLMVFKGAATLRMGGLLFLPLQRAQEIFDAEGELDVIQVVLKDKADLETVRQAIAKALPAGLGLSVHRPSGNSQGMEETMQSSQQGLLLASVFSVLLAAFIILNTFLMNVGERRRQLAIMRAVGATTRQIGGMLIGESLALGLVGTVLGILAGIGGAALLTLSLARLLQTSLPAMSLGWFEVCVALAIGEGISLLGVLIPAYRATLVSPMEGMGQVAREDTEGTSYWATIVGGVISSISAGLLVACVEGWLSIDFAVTTAAFLLVGIVLLLPLILEYMSRIALWILLPILRVEASLAQRQILRHRARSTLTVGVLFVAASTGIGLSSAILDNIQDVRQWYTRALVGDFYVRAAMPNMNDGTAPVIPEGVGAEIRKAPGVTVVDSARLCTVRVGDQKAVAAARDFVTEDLHFDLKEGQARGLRDKLRQGEVVVSTVLAQKLGVHVGDTIPLETLHGTQNLKVAALINDYMIGGLTLYLERSKAEKLLGIRSHDAYVIYADHSRLAETQKSLQAICEKYGVLLHSNADITTMIDGMIAGVDGCLWGILVLGFVVAAFGVVNTLTMNVLEQTRELALLRIVATTRWQVRKTILTQAAIIGGLGLVPGILAGLGVSFLINRAMVSAFGHTIEFTPHPLLLASGFLVGFAIVVFSAFFPAERAARLELVHALQYE